jgi:enoyl-CoA hydratase/carnithine racemase
VHDPESALKAGFYDLVVADDQVVETALERATQLAGTLHPGAFITTRATVRGGYEDLMRGPWIEDLATFTVAVPEA